ncbi:TIGR02281 family clan AA aspartic protease [Rhizobium rhizogenes]|uniref:TIGR02281 family clan AA aspartic protease n=1 Tax=Rhizobium TaxID=379 RepID=UPI00026ED4DD|nr:MULTISPECIES: TIGR02281 family clan AA aspartic protease [Rhizobium]OCJ22001.1 aspartyl protease [Agrobacterium sp. B131/95]EJK79311.1 clan AA aspartic protease, TIGR02281 family [Rhizobium sp. AP16]NTF85673.1 TIGR02281 family clan AA aspartic protease [Rhizobium rhizogenes]NTH10698.1 TIGR02281 family clan AA aspartic protease [Rhizobium rhizogenes]NTI39987.1 TIGR02281 family clan AA aspartic protease [Rhizobium rhizogenes]
MLVRVLVFAGIIAVAATQVPSLLNIQIAIDENSAPMAISPPAGQQVSVVSLSHGSVLLPAGAGGHYQGDFKINGRPVQGMIDTGATYVAINESTARRLGISGSDLDYRYTTQTANGPSKVALVKLDRLEIGTIKVRDVDAVVSKDGALSTTLIGMSFLKKLKSYGAENGSLRLTQ